MENKKLNVLSAKVRKYVSTIFRNIHVSSAKGKVYANITLQDITVKSAKVAAYANTANKNANAKIAKVAVFARNTVILEDIANFATRKEPVEPVYVSILSEKMRVLSVRGLLCAPSMAI